MSIHPGGPTFSLLHSLSSFLSFSARLPAAAGLHLRPAREPDLRPSEACPGWSAAPVDRAVRPAEPRLDRLAARRGFRRGVLDRRRSRRRPLGAAAAARARVSHEAAWRARDIVAARVVCAAPFCVRFGRVIIVWEEDFTWSFKAFGNCFGMTG